MRWCVGTVLFAPLLAQAIVLPSWVHSNASEVQNISDSTAQGNNDRASTTFNVPCQADDESFTFTFEVREPYVDTPCGYSDLRINGIRLHQDWRGSGWGFAAVGRNNVTAESVAATTSAAEGELIGVTSVRIEAIDDSLAKSNAGFTISFDQRRRKLIGLLPSEGSHPGGIEQWQSLEESIDESSVTGLFKQSQHPKSSFDDEVKKLNTLERQIWHLRQVYQKQKQLVDFLLEEQIKSSDAANEECEDIKCALRSLYRKAKNCVHLVYLRFASPFRSSSASLLLQGQRTTVTGPDLSQDEETRFHDELDAPRTHSNASRAYHDSAGRLPHEYPYDLFADFEYNHERAVHIAAGLVASLLCLTCITIFLHRRCCNPRARAERAAAREERRTARDYRYLARRHAWRNWWRQWSFHRSHPTRDYEEKRALILQQEHVLESAMQREMRQLGVLDISLAEEGRATPQMEQMSDSDSLPTYRSRTSSGRPPSYNEFDISIGSVVANGFRSFTPVSADGMDGTDSTPDSSMIISPRLSFETLRTEASAS